MDYSNAKTPTEIMPPEPGESMSPEWMPPDPMSGLSAPVEKMPPESSQDYARRILARWRPEWGPPDPRWPLDPSPILSRVNRILDGARLKNVPADLDQWQHARAYVESPTGLWWDLEEAASHYRAIVYHRKNKARKVKQLKQFQRHLALVQSQKWPRWLNGEIVTLDTHLSLAENWCRSTLAELEIGWHPELKGGNPINWLVGHRLPEIFKEHLKRGASIKPNGPYVRFAMAFLTEFRIAKNNGESYESSTILDALKLARNGHVRSKGRRVPQPTAPQPHIPVVRDDDDAPPF